MLHRRQDKLITKFEAFTVDMFSFRHLEILEMSAVMFVGSTDSLSPILLWEIPNMEGKTHWLVQTSLYFVTGK